MPESLPPDPSLEFLKKQCKQLLRAHKEGQQDACCDYLRLLCRFRSMDDPEILAAPLSLSDCQHAAAIHYGFGTWNKLRTHGGIFFQSLCNISLPICIYTTGG